MEEGPWHPQQDLEEEERDSSRGDEGPWVAESDGDPYAELSYEGQWGSGSSGSPEVLRGGRALCQPHGCSTDGGDTSGLSDISHSPTTPSHRHRGWNTSGDTDGGRRQGWTPSRSLQLQLSDNDRCDATSTEPVPKRQLAGTGLPAPGTPGSAPTKEPWGAGTPPAPQLHNSSQAPKKAAPAVLQPQPGRPSRSLSPRQRHVGDKRTRGPSGPGTSTASGTQYTQYGRGQLNHPLPDLSKVGARVKIDQSYRPPRGRALPPRPTAPRGPIGFKSPAEIVREVLLSSGEGIPPEPPTATPGLPQEFRSPRQATALVQQLQVTPSSPSSAREASLGESLGWGGPGGAGYQSHELSLCHPWRGVGLVTPPQSCAGAGEQAGTQAGMLGMLMSPPGMPVLPNALHLGCLSPGLPSCPLGERVTPMQGNQGHICTSWVLWATGFCPPPMGPPPSLL